MQADLTIGARLRPRRGTVGNPGTVVVARTIRAVARSSVLWGYVFGLTVASSAIGFASSYKTTAQRDSFAALFGANAGLAAIAGPARQLQTVGGYTAWKCSMFLAVAGAVWGLLASTRLLRGEEDAGRWELLLAGRTTRRRATAQVLAGLGVGLAVLWALTAVITVGVGLDARVRIAAGPALYFALSLVSAAAMFLAAGALASQLSGSRRQAAGYAGTALGICYALRMVADSSPDLAWVRWTTPLGWVEELRPLTGPRPLALLPVIALTAALAGAALFLAGRRDTGAGALRERAAGGGRLTLLSGPGALAFRLVLPGLAGWTAAIAAMGLLMGFIARQAGRALTSSASIARVISRFGEHGGSAVAYLGFTFLMITVLVAFLAASLLTAIRAEESGRAPRPPAGQAGRPLALAGRAGAHLGGRAGRRRTSRRGVLLARCRQPARGRPPARTAGGRGSRGRPRAVRPRRRSAGDGRLPARCRLRQLRAARLVAAH